MALIERRRIDRITITDTGFLEVLAVSETVDPASGIVRDADSRWSVYDIDDLPDDAPRRVKLVAGAIRANGELAAELRARRSAD